MEELKHSQGPQAATHWLGAALRFLQEPLSPSIERYSLEDTLGSLLRSSLSAGCVGINASLGVIQLVIPQRYSVPSWKSRNWSYRERLEFREGKPSHSSYTSIAPLVKTHALPTEEDFMRVRTGKSTQQRVF